MNVGDGHGLLAKETDLMTGQKGPVYGRAIREQAAGDGFAAGGAGMEPVTVVSHRPYLG